LARIAELPPDVDQWKQGNQTRRNKRNCGRFESCWTARDRGYRQVGRVGSKRRDWMMQEERNAGFFFLWGKKSLKSPGETRTDETKRTRATAAAPGRRLLAERRGSISISMPERQRGQAAPLLTHSLTHTWTPPTRRESPPQPARGTIARPQEVPAPGGQGGSS
jgi:hypothetical protein